MFLRSGIEIPILFRIVLLIERQTQTIMKKLMASIMLVAAASVVFSQKIKDTDVPSPVKESFKKSFPLAREVKWEKEKNAFEAEFKLNNHEQTATLNANGELQEIETEIPKGDLPVSILSALDKDYHGDKVEEAARIDARGAISYEVELMNGKDRLEIVYDSKGKLVEKKVKKKEDKD